MREIIPGLLWIGNAIEARDIKSVLDREIEAVLDIAIEEKPISFTREIVYCRVPLIDGAGNAAESLQTAVEFVVRFVSARRRTLVACSGGMSRSPAVAAKAMARIRAVSAEAALMEIASIGPHDVLPLFWGNLSEAVPD